MIARILLAVLILTTPAAAELIVSDGDYFARLTPQESASIQGGRVDRLTILGTPVTIEGGSVGQVTLEDGFGGSILLRGGELSWLPGRFSGSIAVLSSTAPIQFEGPHFRVETTAQNQKKIEGILADGSFTRVIVGIDSELCDQTCPYDLRFDLAGELTADLTGDWAVDLDDLNTVRNNFGSPGFDLDTLNDVRNNFGTGTQFTIDPSNAVRASTVPEPAGWIIGAVCLIASYVIFSRHSR